MSAVGHASLRKKLFGLTLTCSLIALAATACTLGAYEWYSFRHVTLAHLRTLTTLVARNSAAALAFSDAEDAHRVLAALQVEPTVEAAALYDDEGRLFAAYPRAPEGKSGPKLPSSAPPQGASLGDGRATLAVPVSEGKRFGTLVVIADIRVVGGRLAAYVPVLIGTTLAACAIALLLTRRLVRRISDPVLALAEAATAVQTSRDYRRRVPKRENDELGILTEAFNAMLTRIGENEAQMQRYGDRLRLALDAGRIGTCDWDLVRDEIICDARKLELMGLDRRLPVKADSFYAALHPEDRPRVQTLLEESIATAGDFSFEARVCGRDGSIRHISCRGRALSADGGPATRIVAVTTDITERHRAELHVLESERRFRAVAEKAPALIWSCDRALERDYFNSTWLAFTGRALDDERGRGWLAGMADEDRVRWRNMALIAATQLNPYTIEYRLRRADGALRWVVENASPRFRADGAFAGYLGSCIDITAGKENEAELEARVRLRTRQLEAANHDLGSFSYSVSHDLRAPVRLIHGFAEIALEECEAGRSTEALAPLRSVLRSAERMNQLIDAFLSLARISRAELSVGEVDLSRMAAEVIEALRLSAPDRSVEVVIAPALICRGDAHLLRILMDNLLGNAWKFTSRTAGARIEVGAEEQDGARAFFVRDNGAGFKEAFAGKMFQAFNRLHTSAQFEGLGVGLNTVLRVIQRHDGRVWAKGEEGAGAVFYFTLPDGGPTSGAGA